MNIRSTFVFSGACLLAVFLSGILPSVQADPLRIGEKAPAFELTDIHDEIRSLDDYAEAEVLVVVFNTNHCPTAQAYEGRLKQLVVDYREKGVAVVVIQPNDPEAIRLDELGYSDLSDTFGEMKVRAAARDFNFPYLYDGDTQEVTRAYGALVTPHVFVFDGERRLRYQGRIDDNENPARIRSHDTRNAIDDLLDGKTPRVETTNVFGCSVKFPDQRPTVQASLDRWDQEKAELKEIDAAGVAELVKNDSGKTRLIKVWATWCAPCVAEFPDVVAMHRMYRNRDRLEIISISMDMLEQKDRALKALDDHHASFTNYIYAGDDRDALVSALDDQWRGPIPYTLLVAPGGEVIYRKSGPGDAREVRTAIVEQIGRTYFE